LDIFQGLLLGRRSLLPCLHAVTEIIIIVDTSHVHTELMVAEEA